MSNVYMDDEGIIWDRETVVYLNTYPNRQIDMLNNLDTAMLSLDILYNNITNVLHIKDKSTIRYIITIRYTHFTNDEDCITYVNNNLCKVSNNKSSDTTVNNTCNTTCDNNCDNNGLYDVVSDSKIQQCFTTRCAPEWLHVARCVVSDSGYNCACGRKNIKRLTYVCCKLNGNVLLIGACCIKYFVLETTVKQSSITKCTNCCNNCKRAFVTTTLKTLICNHDLTTKYCCSSCLQLLPKHSYELLPICVFCNCSVNRKERRKGYDKKCYEQEVKKLVDVTTLTCNDDKIKLFANLKFCHRSLHYRGWTFESIFNNILHNIKIWCESKDPTQINLVLELVPNNTNDNNNTRECLKQLLDCDDTMSLVLFHRYFKTVITEQQYSINLMLNGHNTNHSKLAMCEITNTHNNQYSNKTSNNINEQSSTQPSSSDISCTVVTFGKHINKTYKQVLKVDSGYCDWVLKTGNSSNCPRIGTLNHFYEWLKKYKT